MAETNIAPSRWTQVPATDTIPRYSFFAQDIRKPELDDRDYRMIRLENGLLAVLVHDAHADKAAACLTIAVGHLQDPDDVPGLAHFCEHMIKKGSELYPAENDFLSFIYTNGGVQNAGTSAAWQDYWFSINPSKLSGAIPRQAAFFHSPLFLANLTAREMHAVDSENKRNLQNDSRRIAQLFKSLSREGHPWTKFGTGNIETLTEAAKKKLEEDGQPVEVEDGDGGPVGRAVRERLLKWWEEEYCAGRMTLCVLGNESVEELTNLVVPLYSRIPNRGFTPRPIFEGPVWDDKQRGTALFVKTVKDYHEFCIVFQIDNQAPLYRTRPGRFLAHLLGHEGQGSAYSYLKKRGWVLGLQAGVGSSNPSVNPFTIGGKLTREGYLHYEEVVLTIFNYIALIRDSALELYHFEELKQLYKTFFRFREKSQPHHYVQSIALRLLDPVAEEPQDTLSVGEDNMEWDEPAVRQLLDSFRPENARIGVMAKVHDPSVAGDGENWEVEKWYGAEYRVKKLPKEFLAKANLPNNNSALALPKPNPYVPENLDVNRREVDEVLKAPHLIRDTPLIRVWHKADDQFWVPKAHVKIHIKSPVAYSTPRTAVLSRLVENLLEDSLAEVTYDAELAGLHYYFNSDGKGLGVTVYGYSDKLPLLLDVVLQRLKDIQFEEDRLKVKKEELERAYKNYYLGQPSNLASDFTFSLLTTPWWTPSQKLAEIYDVTLADLEWHKRELLRKVHIETLITGNVTEQRALDIANVVERHLAAIPLPQAEWAQERSSLLAPGSNHVVRKTHDNPKETNSALVYHCQFGDVTNIRLRATSRLLAHILKEPAFSQLRTVEQLGYVVTTVLRIATGTIGFSFKIQSLKSPTVVEERVETFIRDYRATLACTPSETFTDWKEGLVTKLLEKPKNLAEETSEFWSRIHSGHYDFLRNEMDASVVRELTLGEVLAVYDTFLMPGDSAERKKLSYHLLSQQVAEDVQPTSGQVVVDEALFKAGLAYSAAALPVASFRIVRACDVSRM